MKKCKMPRWFWKACVAIDNAAKDIKKEGNYTLLRIILNKKFAVLLYQQSGT